MLSVQFGASFLTRACLTRSSWARPMSTRCQFGARQFGAFASLARVSLTRGRLTRFIMAIDSTPQEQRPIEKEMEGQRKGRHEDIYIISRHAHSEINRAFLSFAADLRSVPVINRNTYHDLHNRLISSSANKYTRCVRTNFQTPIPPNQYQKTKRNQNGADCSSNENPRLEK